MKIARLFLTVAVLLVFGLTTPRVGKAGNDTTPVSEGEILLSYIKARCNQEGIPVRLVHNIIYTESRWRYAPKGEIVGNAMVQSSEDAYGLMQIQLPTAQDMMGAGITAEQLMNDNITNVEAGIRYISWLRTYYKGNVYYAITAYNRGILNVNRDLEGGYNPLNEYTYKVSNGVFFGKKTTLKMGVALTKLKPKEVKVAIPMQFVDLK